MSGRTHTLTIREALANVRLHTIVCSGVLAPQVHDVKNVVPHVVFFVPVMVEWRSTLQTGVVVGGARETAHETLVLECV